MEDKQLGLTEAQVQERIERGEENRTVETVTRSRGRIVRDHLFTLFNLLNFAIAGLLFAVGAYSNMLFIAIIIANIGIGIAQDWKAKRLVDELSILNRPTVRVLRDGREQRIEAARLVRDDQMILDSGCQICSDGQVEAGVIEVNESLLTGESDPVTKQKGDELYSGSFVVSGRARARAVHVGAENYAARLVNEVRKERKVESELIGSMGKVTRFTSMLIVPLGIALFLEAVFLRQSPAEEAVVSSAAALLGMLPKGLVLLISVSLASGVIRLARKKILVQNIYSLETLAHVDTLCLDKTGTLTDGNLRVRRVIPLAGLPQGEMDALVSSYLAASPDNNATFRALQEAFPAREIYHPMQQIPFSSARKWGNVSLAGAGTVFVGAPERLLDPLPENLAEELAKGRRVVAVGYSGSLWEDAENLPSRIQPLYGVVLEDTIPPGQRRRWPSLSGRAWISGLYPATI